MSGYGNYVYVIYRQTYDLQGEPCGCEVIEVDADEVSAARFTKLYTKQTPHDLTDRVSIHSCRVQVV